MATVMSVDNSAVGSDLYPSVDFEDQSSGQAHEKGLWPLSHAVSPICYLFRITLYYH